jgi:Curli production assembly/transport component CsgG
LRSFDVIEALDIFEENIQIPIALTRFARMPMPRHHALAALFLALPLVLIQPACAKAAPTTSVTAARVPIVAITNLDSRGVSKDEVGVIADNLAAKLQQSGKVRVMERSQMDQILKEQSFQNSGACDGSQCAVEMGKLLGIDRIIIGSVGLVGSTYSFNLRLVDVATGEAVRTSARNRKGSIDDVLTELVPAAVADLTESTSPVASAANASDAKKTSLWPWIVGGVVVAGGGAAAAVLMTGGSSSSTPASAVPGPSSAKTTEFKFNW